jgi:hypothetical protein
MYPLQRHAMHRNAALVAMLAALAGCANQPAGTATTPASDAAPILDTSEERGACIGATAQYETCSYAIAVFGPEAAPTLIVSRKLARMNADGQPEWQELDRLHAPSLPRGGSLEFGACRYRAAPDDTVLALLPPYDETSPEHIVAAGWAYRIDLPSGHFVALDAASVDCSNGTIGAD